MFPGQTEEILCHFRTFLANVKHCDNALTRVGSQNPCVINSRLRGVSSSKFFLNDFVNFQFCIKRLFLSSFGIFSFHNLSEIFHQKLKMVHNV